LAGLTLPLVRLRGSRIGQTTIVWINVGDGVKLEVLDCVFEGFALKLADIAHVYAITRRGFGESSKPDRGYSTPELAEMFGA
jgi:hypothetical protein